VTDAPAGGLRDPDNRRLHLRGGAAEDDTIAVYSHPGEECSSGPETRNLATLSAIPTPVGSTDDASSTTAGPGPGKRVALDISKIGAIGEG